MHPRVTPARVKNVMHRYAGAARGAVTARSPAGALKAVAACAAEGPALASAYCGDATGARAPRQMNAMRLTRGFYHLRVSACNVCVGL